MSSTYPKMRDNSKFEKKERKSKSLLFNFYHFYNLYILGNISEEKISDKSTIYSISTKEIEEGSANINTNKSNKFRIFHYYSTKNILKKNKCYSFELKLDKNKNLLKNNNTDIETNPTHKLSENKKFNFVDNNSYQKKNICKININNASIPVNTASIHKNVNKRDFITSKIKKTEISKNDIYTQNKNINCMKKVPPKIPELFSGEYNLDNKNIVNNSNGETYVKLNKGKMPICFYNHLTINANNKKIINKKKLFKSSITYRNNKKILTLIYYSPNPPE